MTLLTRFLFRYSHSIQDLGMGNHLWREYAVRKMIQSFAIIFTGIGLSSCGMWSSGPMGSNQGPNPQSNSLKPPEALVTNSSATGERGLAGSLSNMMDVNDRTKLSHALDKAPGSSTAWVNSNTGISYVVVPTKKITINDNPYCRAYNVTASKDGQSRELSGTACVSPDGSWQATHGG